MELFLSNDLAFDLTGTPATSEVLAPEGALVDLVGGVDRSDMARPGGAGVLPGQARFPAISADIDFYFRTESRERMGELVSEFRRGWSLWGQGVKPVLFRIDGGLSPMFFEAWLSRPIQGAEVDASKRTQLTLPVPVFIPRGLARTSVFRGEGEVLVTNSGDVTVFPDILYSGAGGEVTAPSGAVFTLPPSQDEVVVSMNPARLRLDGVFPEGVAPDDSGVWRLPAGAVLSWVIEVADPW